MVATDGHRLALVERAETIVGLATELRLLIPRRALGELSRLVGEAGEGATVKVASDDRHLFFSTGDRLLISRSLGGTFPNYEAALPREHTKLLEDTDQVRAAVKRVSLLASEQSGAVPLFLDKDRLEITSSGGDYGEAAEVLDARYDLEPVRIGFNYQYLLDFFEAVKGAASIRMSLKDEQSAVEFQPVEDQGYEYRYVLMPLRF